MQHKNITLCLIQLGTILSQHLKCHWPIVLPLKKVTGQMSTAQLSQIRTREVTKTVKEINGLQSLQI